MRVHGACHCGAIGYEAEVDPAKTIICHCSDCQAISGAPYRVNVPVLAENLTLRGKPTTYEKTGGSGARVTTAFCGTCGAAVYSCKGEAPAFLFLRTGLIAERAALVPTAQGFCEAGMSWAMDIREVAVVGPRT